MITITNDKTVLFLPNHMAEFARDLNLPPTSARMMIDADRYHYSGQYDSAILRSFVMHQEHQKAQQEADSARN